MKPPVVLVVDDQQDNLFVVREVIISGIPDCRVITTPNPLDGLKIAADEDVDVAIVDVQMPDIDGVETCRRLKSTEATSRIPVILITSHATCGDYKARGLDAGAADFISRPIDNIELLARVRAVLRTKRAEDELRETIVKLVTVSGERDKSISELQELERITRKIEQSRDEMHAKTSQLVQTGKMIALGELSAGVAHEINQPLNAINIICQDVLRDIRKDRLDMKSLEQNLDDTVREVRRIADIVNHMRIFSRETMGTRRERIEIHEPVEGVFSLIGQQLTLHGIQVSKQYSAGLKVVGDRVRLEQVFMNLIANARDAVSRNESGKHIFVKTYATKDDRQDADTVAFEIRDNGCGIPSHIRDRIFDPFFTSKEPGEGTGLGLSVASQIINEHGGRIAVESDEGNGTVFTVLLPAAKLRHRH